uniref:Uncharacterized protein n=1 Tax=Lepeophtheirus salmonis TaxID=72036 RepID=A0A0K2UL08_LEPSM
MREGVLIFTLKYEISSHAGSSSVY